MTVYSAVAFVFFGAMFARSAHLKKKHDLPRDYRWHSLTPGLHAEELAELRALALRDKKLTSYFAKVATQGRSPIVEEWRLAREWVSSPTRRVMSR